MKLLQFVLSVAASAICFMYFNFIGDSSSTLLLLVQIGLVLYKFYDLVLFFIL